MNNEALLELLLDLEALLELERLIEAEERLFLAISAEMTGYSLFDLRATGMTDAYFKTVWDVIGGERLGAMLAWFALCQEVDPGNIQTYLRRGILSNPLFGPVVRNIIKLWYLGSWYPLPDEWRRQYGTSPADYLHVVDALEPANSGAPSFTRGRGHVEGLVWKALKSHPMGAKQPGYGTWADPPDQEEAQA